MPVICMFGRIKIYIYIENDGRHKIPHLHAYYAEDSIVLDFAGNNLPRKNKPC